MMLASVLRLISWLVCTVVFYKSDENFLKYAIYERIKKLTIQAKAENETYWLPLEPKYVSGLEQAPKTLVVSIFGPDVFVIISYMALCWLCFSVFIDSHCRQEMDPRPIKACISGRMIFWVLTFTLIVLQVTIVSLYGVDKITPSTILTLL